MIQEISPMAQASYSPGPPRSQPRSLTIEEVDGGFVVNAYDPHGNCTRLIAHNPRVLGRKLKAWADPTPATPAIPPAPATNG